MDKETEARLYAMIGLKLNELLYENGDIGTSEHDRAYMALCTRLTGGAACGIIDNGKTDIGGASPRKPYGITGIVNESDTNPTGA